MTHSPLSDRTPVLALAESVLLPGDVATIAFVRPENLRTLALGRERGSGEWIVAPLDGPCGGGFGPSDLAPVGTLARVLRSDPLPAGGARLVLQGLRRVHLDGLALEGGALVATPRENEAAVAHEDAQEWERLAVERLGRALRELAACDASFPRELSDMMPFYGTDLGRLTDLSTSSLPLPQEERVQLLVETDPRARVALLERYLTEARVRIETGDSVDEKVKDRVRRDFLIAKMRALRDELGELSPIERESRRLSDRLDATPMTDAARASATRALEHIRRLVPTSYEAARVRNWLDWMIEFPWVASARPPLEGRERAREVAAFLAKSHEGLEEVKQRIFEFLAIRQLGGGAQGTVLCFLGPPGTGKSSMGRAVAKALERPFVSIPVGAMTHEREIVGVSHMHENGAPGAILAGLHRTGVRNPVILVDEIDKLRLGGEGTSAGALLQLLDPEQNAEFLDHYLGLPFDLSPCLLLATANDAEDIPDALLDRMEIIEFNGYTEEEKYSIARHHLVPRARAQAGVSAAQLKISPSTLRAIIRGYTEEAGVRELQRQLISLARKAAVRVIGESKGLSVKKADLVQLLGPRTVDEELRLRRPAVGVATGLAWTSVGGALLPIEAISMPGSGRMILTGQIGDIMRESVQTAVSYVRTCFGQLHLAPDCLDQVDVHLHFPSAATPKDGPSAGIAVVTALVSLLTGWPARHDVAMTGEMSLLGQVLPVGGVREKLLAAIRAGIPEVVVPKTNAEDILRLPSAIRNRVTVHLVQDVQQALGLSLVKLPGPKSRRRGGTQGRRSRASAKKQGPDALEA